MKSYSLIFLLLIVFSCAKTKETPSDFDYGHMDGSKYTNSYFGVEIEIPGDWMVQSQEQADALSKQGGDMIAGDNSNLNAVLKASEVNTANLLVVYQFEAGSAVEFNPSIMLIAENVKKFPGIKNGGDYLFQSRKLLEQSQVKYDTLDSNFQKEVISGIDFYKMKGSINYGGIDIKQTYYSTVLKGFSFNLIISYATDEQRTNLLNAVGSMKFQ